MDNDRTATLVANLRAELARRGLKQGDLARIWDLSEMSVSRRMNGLTPISADELAQAALAFEMEPGDLLADQRRAASA
jgi:transcriptional regulator with XRE-family HTH domain